MSNPMLKDFVPELQKKIGGTKKLKSDGAIDRLMDG